MRAYDLHVQEESQNMNKIKGLCSFANALGFSGLAIETSNSLPLGHLDEHFLMFRRITLSPKNAARLRFIVKKRRKLADIFAIHGRTKPISLAAAIIPAVDLVMLRDHGDFVTVDSQVARVLAKQEKPVEICLRGLLSLSGPNRSRLMRAMASAVSCLLRADCLFILTSGAKTRYGIRSPRDLAALSYFANIPEDAALKGIYDNPSALVERLLKTRDSKNEVRE
jgi:RNase P/RNase MRP subunit p30